MSCLSLRQSVESNALLSLSLPTDGDFVFQREGWFMDWSMRLFPHEQGVDSRCDAAMIRSHCCTLLGTLEYRCSLDSRDWRLDAETARLRKRIHFNDCVLVLQSESAGTDAIVTKVGY